MWAVVTVAFIVGAATAFPSGLLFLLIADYHAHGRAWVLSRAALLGIMAGSAWGLIAFVVYGSIVFLL